MKIKKTTPEITKVIESTSAKMKVLLDGIDFSEQAKNNPLYTKYAKNKFHYYIGMEVNRYIRALEVITQRDPSGTKTKVTDFGCMLPFLPTALSELGYDVTIVDKYEYYGDSFKESIFDFCAENSVKIVDLDIVNDSFDALGSCDIALNLAVVEHFNGSPKEFLRKVSSKINPDGFFVFDVPNIANFVKRIRVLMGYSPLDDYNDYLNSPYPYSGHNREMTVDEVTTLMAVSGFDLEHIETYDFNPYSTVTRKGSFLKAIKPFVPIKNLGECILAVSKVARKTC